MTNTHMDQLTEWWENAEQGVAHAGDTVIVQIEDDAWQVETAGVDQEESPYIRILARAPKPKPAWHDAVAVLAHHRDYADERRTVWVQIGGDEYDRVNIEGDTAAEHHLVDVTPLIEAKITGAMILAAISAYRGIDRSALSEFTRDEVEDMRRALAGALGLDVD